jgi:prepilin-type N-terminal cleavage/methylation domain-containing protein
MRRPSLRGFTLLEVVIALAILFIGLTGMLQLQIFGTTANGGARMQTQAEAVARELAAGLERLQFGDTLVTETGSTSVEPPTPFGPLVDPVTGSLASGAHEWDDATPVPGVRLEDELPGTPGTYQRRWTVWGYAETPGSPAGVRIVAVSVAWREPSMPRLREVVLYTQVRNPAAINAGNLAQR